MSLGKLIILILISVGKFKSGHCWFWYKKAPLQKPKNNEKLIAALKTIIIELISAIKLLVTVHLIEVVVFLMFIITLFFIIRWLYKGRPIYATNDTKSQSKTDRDAQNMSAMSSPTNNASTTVNLYGSMQFKNPRESPNQWNNGSNFPSIRVPEQFKEDMCVETWIDQMESYVRQFEKGLWVEIAASYISETPYKKIRNMKELKVKDDGFSELTKLLREKYAMNHRICQENTLTFSHLLDRVQMDNESVSDFGHKLIEISKIALPRTDLNHIDDILKDQFIFGISNEMVRMRWKNA